MAHAQLIWSDEFDTGTQPDTSIWSYDLGASGWGNNELQEYTSSYQNARVEDGNLVITVLDGANGFTSARIRTEDKLTFKYGRIEARIKMPDLADGLWPAFWTLGNNFSQVGWPFCGELDIMEMGNSAAIAAGTINRRVSSTAHWDNDGAYASYGLFVDVDSDLDDGFHIYSMDWNPDTIRTYIDGRLIWTIRINEDSCTSCTEFHQPHFVILNVAVGGNFTGLLSEDQITAATPAEMVVDYVRISDNGFTEMGGSGYSPRPSGIGPEYSGSWFNPDQSGHGFSMEFDELEDGSTKAVIYWYTYDDQGNPIFMLGNGVTNDFSLEIEFESPYGMKYGEFDPDSVVRENGGTARFDFSDPANATFSYTPSGFSSATWGHITPVNSLPLVKLFSVSVSNSDEATD
jgi:beta-glucanase (GH16 family)